MNNQTKNNTNTTGEIHMQLNKSQLEAAPLLVQKFNFEEMKVCLEAGISLSKLVSLETSEETLYRVLRNMMSGSNAYYSLIEKLNLLTKSEKELFFLLCNQSWHGEEEIINSISDIVSKHCENSQVSDIPNFEEWKCQFLSLIDMFKSQYPDRILSFEELDDMQYEAFRDLCYDEYNISDWEEYHESCNFRSDFRSDLIEANDHNFSVKIVGNTKIKSYWIDDEPDLPAVTYKISNQTKEFIITDFIHDKQVCKLASNYSYVCFNPDIEKNLRVFLSLDGYSNDDINDKFEELCAEITEQVQEEYADFLEYHECNAA